MKIELATWCPQKHEDGFSNHTPSLLIPPLHLGKTYLSSRYGAAAEVCLGAGRACGWSAPDVHW